MRFNICGFLKNLSIKSKFHQNQTRTEVTLHEDHYTFFIVSHSFLLRMRNVSDKGCTENQKIHFVFSNSFLKIVLFEIMWKNAVQ